MVPVIVNAILNEHQLVIDIVAFVNKGDFHRSRLGEKQRGKILAGWVTRKMRTIAQYSIRDPNGENNQITEVAEPQGRASMGTFKTGGPGSMKGSMMGGSTRGSMLGLSAQMGGMHMSATPTGLSEMAAGHGQGQVPPGTAQSQLQQPINFAPPAGFSEMPAPGPGQAYPESIPERAELATGSLHNVRREGSDDTPTESRGLHLHQGLDFSFDDLPTQPQQMQQYGAEGINMSPSPLTGALRSGTGQGQGQEELGGPPDPRFESKPYLSDGQQKYHEYDGQHQQYRGQEQQYQPLQYQQEEHRYQHQPHHEQRYEEEQGGYQEQQYHGDRWGLPSQNQSQQHSAYDGAA
jgi:hypothetical protein